jgi:aminopeptidase N
MNDIKYDVKVRIDSTTQHISCVAKLMSIRETDLPKEYLLLKNLSVNNLTVDEKPVEFEEEHVGAQFMPFARIIKLQKTGHELTIEYSGNITGDITKYNNGIYADFIILTDYAPWFPTPAIDFKVTVRSYIDSVDSFRFLNSRYDEAQKNWTHEGRMIIGIQNHKIETAKHGESEFFVIYFDPEEREAAQMHVQLSLECLQFYEDELLNRELPPKQVGFVRPSNPINNGWGFIREGITVFGGKLSENENDAAYSIAHEMGHIWSTGAPLNWEDWLNESFAEYGALLFLEKHLGEQEYESRISQLIKTNNAHYSNESIKPVDNEQRSMSVHTKGAIVLDQMRKSFGRSTVTKTLRCFDQLLTKNTARLLGKIKNAGMSDVADWLFQKICEPF